MIAKSISQRVWAWLGFILACLFIAATAVSAHTLPNVTDPISDSAADQLKIRRQAYTDGVKRCSNFLKANSSPHQIRLGAAVLHAAQSGRFPAINFFTIENRLEIGRSFSPTTLPMVNSTTRSR